MTQATYEYRLHPQDARVVMVRGHHQAWRKYGIFASIESAVYALKSLRMAQERERAEREGVVTG